MSGPTEHPIETGAVRPLIRSTVLLGRYRSVVRALERRRAKHFYHGTPVMVMCNRYHGQGVAVTDHLCPPDKVAVALPNGNTWWYPMEAVRPNTEVSDAGPLTPELKPKREPGIR